MAKDDYLKILKTSWQPCKSTISTFMIANASNDHHGKLVHHAVIYIKENDLFFMFVYNVETSQTIAPPIMLVVSLENLWQVEVHQKT